MSLATKCAQASWTVEASSRERTLRASSSTPGTASATKSTGVIEGRQMSYCPEDGHQMTLEADLNTWLRYRCSFCGVKWVYDNEERAYYADPDWDSEEGGD